MSLRIKSPATTALTARQAAINGRQEHNRIRIVAAQSTRIQEFMATAAAQHQQATPPDLQPIPGFDFFPRTRLIFGQGTFERLGELVREFNARRVLLVTDPGLRIAGHGDRAIRILESAGINTAVFDEVRENPTTDDVERCLRFAQGKNIELIVGLGGGSSMDCAKGANFVLSNGGRIHDYRGIGKARNPMLPMIAVPTTSGTGSEAQSFAVIADADSHIKMACGDHKASCRVAILDPELTVTMPRAVAAATGIDALTHSIESYVTTRRNPVSGMFARQAFQLLARAFPLILRNPDDLSARGDMQLGAFLAGLAIENSMLGAAHAAANPVTARFDTPHGIAVGLMLPHVIRWNAPVVSELYRELALAVEWVEAGAADGTAAEQLATGFTEFLRMADMPVSLSQALDADVDESVISELAAGAAQQWTGTFNPRTMEESAFADLYRNAL